MTDLKEELSIISLMIVPIGSTMGRSKLLYGIIFHSTFFSIPLYKDQNNIFRHISYKEYLLYSPMTITFTNPYFLSLFFYVNLSPL